MWYQRARKNLTRRKKRALGGGFVVFVVSGHGLKVFGFEHLVAIQAPNVVYPVPPRQDLGTIVLAGLHKKYRLSPF
jgi:hypothetical protein